MSPVYKGVGLGLKTLCLGLGLKAWCLGSRDRVSRSLSWSCSSWKGLGSRPRPRHELVARL